MTDVSKQFVYTLLVAMILTGAANTLVYKWQNSMWVDGYPFNHPFMQATTMFVGEALVLIIFFVKINKNKEVYQEERQVAASKGLDINSKGKYLYLAIPAAADFMTSSL